MDHFLSRHILKNVHTVDIAPIGDMHRFLLKLNKVRSTSLSSEEYNR